ncbi:uncharacterized protein LOC111438020 [Cucurbita moschata]|uniref:Uncharacterized protein LOC111438020 n=1 Tax=Cucurbita moschata TaxID=3662 RepID=A0A6J1EZM4_CUCMO|nr:uncharacterized protein LOC111438020 [Cucurbita moschata]
MQRDFLGREKRMWVAGVPFFIKKLENPQGTTLRMICEEVWPRPQPEGRDPRVIRERCSLVAGRGRGAFESCTVTEGVVPEHQSLFGLLESFSRFGFSNPRKSGLDSFEERTDNNNEK